MSEEMNMAALLAAEEESIKEINEHDLVDATVVAVNDNEAIVNVKGIQGRRIWPYRFQGKG